MKANNLSISIPNKGCDKNCPYCISKMTGYIKSDITKMMRNIDKVKKLANTVGITSISFTGKGEPLLNMDDLEDFAYEFKDYPLEVQTNGKEISGNITKANNLLKRLYNAGIDTIAISVDNLKDLRSLPVNLLNEYGFTIRITFNLIKGIYEHNPETIIDFLSGRIHQVSFREITSPNYELENSPTAQKTRKWIEDNVDNEKVNIFKNYLKELKEKSFLIRELPYGAKLYYYNKVSFTYFDYCIQDNSNSDDVRSIIFYEDGHVSTTWYGSDVGRII